jgi:CRISPR-associated protein Cmr1
MRAANDRLDPQAALAAWQRDAAGGLDAGWKTYKCKLATPMYGGGVRAGEVDRALPIRVPSIRGQLRFWWRVARGPFASSAAMFQRESALWGGIASSGPTASQVAVKVTCAPVADAQLVSSDAEHDAGVKYAFGPATINGVAQWLMPAYSFTLALRYSPDAEEDVLAALRWWASFGGLGARTRRGFGAIHVDSLEPLSADSVAAAGGALRFSGAGGSNAESEWKRAIGRMYEYRQKGGTGRRAGNPRPGRSYWPEPDQIRRFTGRDANGMHMPEHAAGNCFPRAAFGLPILFEFKGSPGEPPKTELLPAGGEDRMASPLILRPYWTGQRWRAAALLLPGWEKALSQPLRFKSLGSTPEHWPVDPLAREVAANQIAPMKRGGEPRADDPLSAFMQFFEEA